MPLGEPINIFEAFDWSTRELALVAFCSVTGADPDDIRVTGPDGGPYTFDFVGEARPVPIRRLDERRGPIDPRRGPIAKRGPHVKS